MVFPTLEDVIALRRRTAPDVLSDVLAALRLSGAVFFDNEAHSPWVSAAPTVAQIATFVLPECERIVPFHMVTAGFCWLEIEGDPASSVRLETGDVIIVAKGDEHFLSSAPGMRETQNLDDYRRVVERGAPVSLVANASAGGPETCHFICGYVGCDAQPFNPLLDALPRTVCARPPAESRELLAMLVRAAITESLTHGVGSVTMTVRMAELMFVDVVRRHIEALPDGAHGWLAAVKDQHIGTALGVIHRRPTEAWTIEALAREAGLGRSAFAERFAATVGIPPMQYIARWRLQLAARLLGQPNVSIAQAATDVGYESEAAFKRAFKKYVGLPPGAWRKGRLSKATVELAITQSADR